MKKNKEIFEQFQFWKTWNDKERIITEVKKFMKALFEEIDEVSKKKLICHADINGAMNIVRKVIPEFNIETIRNASKKHEDKEQIKKI